MTQKGPADRGPFAFRVSFNHEQNHTKCGCLSFTCSPFHQVLALPIAHHCARFTVHLCSKSHSRKKRPKIARNLLNPITLVVFVFSHANVI